jgi:hypothetical protein
MRPRCFGTGSASISAFGCVPIMQISAGAHELGGPQQHRAIGHAHGARVEPHIDAPLAHLAQSECPSEADSSGNR